MLYRQYKAVTLDRGLNQPPESRLEKVVHKRKTPTELDNRYWKLMKRVAGNIRRVREAKLLTQEDMMTLGMERRWYQRIESGKYSVSLPTLDRVSRALKVDISEFFK